MYRLLSAHVLALIDDSVISIESYIVLQDCFLPQCLASSDPVSQCGDLYCGQIHMPLTKCFMLGSRMSAMDELLTVTITKTFFLKIYNYLISIWLRR